MAAGSLVADQNVGPIHREREVVIRVDCGKRVLLLRSYDVFVLRSERQAVEVVCVILDAGIRDAWQPDLRLKGATQPCYAMASNLNYPAMQASVSEAASMKIVPVGRSVSVVVTVDEPDLSDVKDRSQDHVQGQAAFKVTQENHCFGTMKLHQPDDMIKAPVNITQKPNHSFPPRIPRSPRCDRLDDFGDLPPVAKQQIPANDNSLWECDVSHNGVYKPVVDAEYEQNCEAQDRARYKNEREHSGSQGHHIDQLHQRPDHLVLLLKMRHAP